MADRPNLAAHSTHDLELVARAAAADLAPSEAMAARDLLASCAACAFLAADLQVIVAATRALGPAMAGATVPPAPRDFRLTEADAARLRRRGFLDPGGLRTGLRGRVRAFGGALAALGLIGLLVSAGMPSLFLGAGGAATSESAAGLAKEGPTMAADAAQVPADGYSSMASEDARRLAATPADADAPAPGGTVVLVVASSVALLTGIALLLASRGGRRAGP